MHSSINGAVVDLTGRGALQRLFSGPTCLVLRQAQDDRLLKEDLQEVAR